MKKNLAIIPIRSGSKRIKNKNIKIFNRKPLVYNAINTALKSKLFEKIVISSDSSKYLNLIKDGFNSNKVLDYLKRTHKISSNLSNTELAIDHAIKFFQNYDNVFLIQATSPLLQYSDLINGYKKFKNSNLDSLFSCYISGSFIWSYKNDKFKPENYDFKNRPMSQSFKNKKIIENGAFYIFKFQKYLKFRNRLFGNIGFYEMNKYLSIDIDNINDFKIAEFINKNIKYFKN